MDGTTVIVPQPSNPTNNDAQQLQQQTHSQRNGLPTPTLAPISLGNAPTTSRQLSSNSPQPTAAAGDTNHLGVTIATDGVHDGNGAGTSPNGNPNGISSVDKRIFASARRLKNGPTKYMPASECTILCFALLRSVSFVLTATLLSHNNSCASMSVWQRFIIYIAIHMATASMVSANRIR
jgi:hypothetical protein